MRILLDVNILVRANENSRGPARDLLLDLITREATILISVDMLGELSRVLRYPRIQQIYGLSEEQIYNYTLFLRSACLIVPRAPLLNSPVRDPNDIHVLQTAVAGEADIICTMDADFFDAATLAYCTAGIEVYNDRDLRRRLASR